MNRFRTFPWPAITLGVAAILAVASCATAPEAPVEKKASPTVYPLPEAEMTRARQLRGVIEQYGLAAYAPEAYRQADGRFEEGESHYSKENDKSKAALQEATRGYQAVLDQGFPVLTDERQTAADGARAQAETLKAQVALKDSYRLALNLYEQAVAAEAAGNYAQAVDLFTQVRPRFEELAVQARQKKEQAEKSLLSSQETLQRAEERALEAREAQTGLQGEGL